MQDSLPSVSETIAKYDLTAKKSLGQNFIINESLTDKIVKVANLKSSDVVIEIGPGPGCLSRSILKASPAKLIVIEKDERFLPALDELKSHYPDKLEIINTDALLCDLKQIINKNCKIIANLPYNIAAKLIAGWLSYGSMIEQMVLMVQDEMADRIIGKNKADFGRLAVLCNLAAKTKKEFKVAATAFRPPPKVTSAIVSFAPYVSPLFDSNIKVIEKYSTQLFQGKRKNLRNVFKQSNWPLAALENLNIPTTSRAEDLSLEQIAKLLTLLACLTASR